MGAEKTLGRMVAEKKSGMYTAVALGQVLFSRHFTVSRQVNPYSATVKPEQSTKLFASEDGTLSKVAKTVPEPQELMTMLDALEANKFAFMVGLKCRGRRLLHVVAGPCPRQPAEVPADP
ncbi:unnamed protein product [Symbiodinium sp. CCMP2456]|nr:unnamed protein product [Symbiodinium sp. CCMP2456]